MYISLREGLKSNPYYLHRELGKNQVKFSKEQKQDLMHVGVCALLSRSNYYVYIADDAAGWPHYEYNRTMPKLDAVQQEN